MDPSSSQVHCSTKLKDRHKCSILSFVFGLSLCCGPYPLCVHSSPIGRLPFDRTGGVFPGYPHMAPMMLCQQSQGGFQMAHFALRRSKGTQIKPTGDDLAILPRGQIGVNLLLETRQIRESFSGT